MISTQTKSKPPQTPPVPITDERGEVSGYLMNASGAQWLAVERRALASIGLKEVDRERE